MTNPRTHDQYPSGAEDDHAPSFEPWMKTAFAAFIPPLVSFFLPRSLQPYFFAAGGALVLASIVMLVAQERRKRSIERS
jgi:hypothetical protein